MRELEKPKWLPDEINLSGGNISKDYETLYEVFRDIFINKKIIFNGNEVLFDTGIDTAVTLGKYPRGFIHIITKENPPKSGIRIIDYDRATKIPWIKAIIENHDNDSVSFFIDNNHNGSGQVRFYFWLEEFDFVVILGYMNSKKEANNILITAFHIGGNSYRRKLTKKRDKYNSEEQQRRDLERELDDIFC